MVYRLAELKITFEHWTIATSCCSYQEYNVNNERREGKEIC